MLRPVRISGPDNPVVTLAEIKAHVVAADFTDDDTILATYIQAATDHLDGWGGVLGRCLVEQDWRIDMGAWPADRCIRLPFPDVSSVTIKYFDEDNNSQTVSSALYQVLEDAKGSFVRFLDGFTWPAVYGDRFDTVQVTLTAGYGAASDVPASIKAAIMLLAAHWYENREAVALGSTPATIPMGVDRLIETYRRVGV